MKKLVIFGAGSFAEVVRYYFESDSGLQAIAHTVDGDHLREQTFQGLPVVPFEDLEKAFPPESHLLFLAIGSQRVNQVRAAKYEAVRQLGYSFASYLSSRACIMPNVVHGPNTIVVEGSLLGPFVRLGANVFILGSRIHHHVQIGDHCTLAEATLAGGVTVGTHTFFGLNACVKERLSVGSHNVIGPGAIIGQSTKDYEVYRPAATKPSSISSKRLAQLSDAS